MMKNRKQEVFLAFMLALLFLSSACSYVQRNTPEVNNAKDAVAVTYATIGAGTDITLNLLQAGTIDADTARSSKSILERAFGLTKIAERSALAGEPDNAQAVLQQVNGLIVDVQGILKRKF